MMAVGAAEGVRLVTAGVIAQGGKVFPGKSVIKPLRQKGTTSGVQFADGTTFDAALVILAAGSWTVSSFPNLNFRVVPSPEMNLTISCQMTWQHARVLAGRSFSIPSSMGSTQSS